MEAEAGTNVWRPVGIARGRVPGGSQAGSPVRQLVRSEGGGVGEGRCNA